MESINLSMQIRSEVSTMFRLGLSQSRGEVSEDHRYRTFSQSRDVDFPLYDCDTK